jgi:hypothetical protein
MLPIHLRHHVVTAKGQEFKAVTCENCRVEFVYLLTRHVEGWATGVMFLDGDAPNQAARQASAELCHALPRDQDPVPCPACGWYQKSMLPLIRAQHWGWMSVAGVFVLYVAALTAVLGALGWALAPDPAAARARASFVEAGAWGAAAGCGLILAHRLLAASVRPNDGDPEARKEVGRRLARTRAEFDRLLAVVEDRAGDPTAEPRRQSGSEL